MRTITQRTTFPFLIAESGAASFTAAVTTSPSPARNPRSPPRGKIQDSLRAPLLSATSRMVRIPIMTMYLLAVNQSTLSGLLFECIQGRRLDTHLDRPPHNLAERPALQLA